MNSAAEEEHLLAEAEAMKRALDGEAATPATATPAIEGQVSMEEVLRVQSSASSDSLPVKGSESIYENLSAPGTTAGPTTLSATVTAPATPQATPAKAAFGAPAAADIYGTPEGTARGKAPGPLAEESPPSDDIYGTPEGNEFGRRAGDELSPLRKAKEAAAKSKPMFKNPPMFNDVEVDLQYEEYNDKEENPNKAGLVAAGLYIPPTNPQEAHYRQRTKSQSAQGPASQLRHRTTAATSTQEGSGAPGEFRSRVNTQTDEQASGQFRSRAGTQVDQPETGHWNRPHAQSGAATQIHHRARCNTQDQPQPSQLRRVSSSAAKRRGSAVSSEQSSRRPSTTTIAPFEGVSEEPPPNIFSHALACSLLVPASLLGSPGCSCRASHPRATRATHLHLATVAVLCRPPRSWTASRGTWALWTARRRNGTWLAPATTGTALCGTASLNRAS